MIRCPNCRGYSRVVNSRPTLKSMRRRRRCTSCGRVWTTYELTDDLETLLKNVVKECEPVRMRLRHIEAEMYHLGAALRAIQKASEGEGYTIVRGLSRQARIQVWSKLEKMNLDQLYGVIPTSVLAERFGRTPLAIYQQARKRGLTAVQKGTKHASSHKAKDSTEHQQGRKGRQTAEASSSYRPLKS